MNLLPREKRLLILKLICRHGGINDIVDITGCSPNTVRAQMVRMGRACASIHDCKVRDIAPQRLELDELWSYVYVKRERNLWKRDNNKSLGPRVRKPPEDRGQRYTWVAHDPDSKMVVSYHTGDRGFRSAVEFSVDLSSRVVNRPLISTDAHPVYVDAIQRAFGDGMDHVVLKKKFRQWRNPETGETGKVLIGVDKEAQGQSKADINIATTAHVERMNANIRNFNSRFTRQTYRFSKKFENHASALSICLVYYNFVRSHSGFLQTEWKHCPPAMKAGLTDTAWSYDDFLDEIDAALESSILNLRPTTPPLLLPQYTRLGTGMWSAKPFLVSYSPYRHAAKVHTAHCRDCQRAAKGRKEGPRANEWYDFDTKQAALKCAETLAPVDFSVCSICILGHYPGGLALGRGPGGRKTVN